MATKLQEGHEYGLSSNAADGKKTLIHFKLTDSAVRALEEYSKSKETCRQTPTIQFTNNSGVMCIPSLVSTSNDDNKGSFKLTLSKTQGNANGSFDCIQQFSARHASGLHCLGSMQFKVATHANNDVYRDTRKKIAFADNESKKICAKEIKMSSRFKGKMVKKVIPSSQYKALQTTKSSPLSTPRGSTIGRVTPPPPRALSPHQPLSVNRTLGRSLVSSNGVTKLESQAKSKPGSGVINMPYRDRVTHLLALRAYKKPELLARLMKDGIRDKDRNCLGALLKQIAVMNKDNSYSLAKHAWQNVRSDWPFYSEADKDLLKKNQQQHDARVSVSPSVSPTVHPADRPSPPSISQKRGSEEDYGDIPNKRQRRSHQSMQHQQQQQQKQQQQQQKQQQQQSSAPSLPHSHTQHHHSAQSLAAKAAGVAIAAQPRTPSTDNQNRDDNADTAPLKYLTQYTEIKNCNQRKHYKEDFNKFYKEYKSLLERMEGVTQKFVSLKEQILNTTEGTQEFEELYATVMEEYEKHKDDKPFWQDKKRLDFLHGKLGHIKHLIKEFDKNRHLKECAL